MDLVKLNESIDKRANHIFRLMEGHLYPDTMVNRQLLIETVLNSDHYLGRDKWKNDWYVQNLADGKQVWVQIRKGEIINGGLNLIPRNWNTITGLSRITPP